MRDSVIGVISRLILSWSVSNGILDRINQEKKSIVLRVFYYIITQIYTNILVKKKTIEYTYFVNVNFIHIHKELLHTYFLIHFFRVKKSGYSWLLQ